MKRLEDQTAFELLQVGSDCDNKVAALNAQFAQQISNLSTVLESVRARQATVSIIFLWQSYFFRTKDNSFIIPKS